MSTIDLTAETFESTVMGEGIVLVDWWAAWCGPCRMFAPVFEKSSETHSDIVFAKVDTEAEQGLAAAAQISSIPTLMVFRDGILVFREAGALPEPALEDLIGQVRALDMYAIRAQIASDRNATFLEANVHELQAMLDDAVLVDVREEYEFVEGHVDGSRLIPLGTLPQHVDDLPKDKDIYLICRSGNRSAKAAEFLATMGFSTRNVTGGVIAWSAAGYELVPGRG